MSSRPTQHTFFHVSLDSPTSGTVSGRLLLFIAPATGNSTSVDVDIMSPASVYVAAKEVPHLEPGESIDIDADDLVFPSPFSTAPAGEYRVQAVLDIHHSYNYNGRAPGDLLSAPISIHAPLTLAPTLALSQVVPEPTDALADRPDVTAALKPLDLVSPSLTRFWGRQIHMRGWVLLPPDYDAHPRRKYPTVYFTHGFGGTLQGIRARYAPVLYDRMKQERCLG